MDRPVPQQVSGTLNAVAVAAGWHHTLAITTGGGVVAWGWNSEGMLGDGTQQSRNAPVPVSSISGIAAVAAGRFHSLALKNTGVVYAWGSNAAGQLGDGTTAPKLTPSQVPGLTGVVAISAGDHHSLALKSNGDVYAWGLNGSGQLGDGTVLTRTSPVKVANVSGITAIAAGLDHSIFLTASGTLWGTGLDTSGQLGDGSGSSQLSPAMVPGLYTVAAIAAGGTHTVARLQDGTTWAWGANAAGEVGDGTGLAALVPTLIQGLPQVTQLAAGFGGQNVAVASDNSVWGWGRNSDGQVGDGTHSNRFEPIKISESNFAWKVGTPIFGYPPSSYTTELLVAVSTVTPSATIFYTTDGSPPTTSSSVYATPISLTTSKVIKAFATATSKPPSNVAVGVYSLEPAKPTFTPGEGTYSTPQNVTISTTSPGVTIRYTTDSSPPTATSTAYSGPVSISTLTTLKAAGFRTGWDPGRTAVAAYSFNYGTLATPTASPTPGAYAGSVLVTLSATSGATIRYTTDGSIPTEASTLYTGAITLNASATVKARAWKTDWTVSAVASATYTVAALAPAFTPGGGSYSIGQTITLTCASPAATIRYTLDGSTPTTSDPGVPSGTTIFAGSFTLKAKAWAPGMDPSAVTSATYSISGTPGSGSVAAGGSHSLVLTSSGTVWAWGANSSGQLGNGSTTPPVYAPTQVSGLTNVVAVEAGYQHSLALKSDGTVWSWGDNTYGQLGNGVSGTYSASPVQVTVVTGFTNVVAISAGQHHSLAVTSNGNAWAWGYNSDGQLGDNSTTMRTTPVQVFGLTTASGIAAGTSHSIALKQDGTVVAWGLNSSGQLGNGLTAPSSVPVSVSSLSSITKVSAGQSHSLARMTDGSTWAWGDNSYGQLGNSSYAPSATAIEVWGVTGATMVRSGVDARFSLALQADHIVEAWGDNGNGQLGNGTTTGSNIGAPVQGLPEVVAVAAGTTHALAIGQDGSVWGWGGNSSSQVGDGTTINRWLPVKIADAGFAWRAATPVISPDPGTYASAQSVSITTTTSGGTIRYTTNGSEPSGSSTVYSGPMSVSTPTTIKAKTFKSGLANSSTAVSAYAFKVATPELGPAGGAFNTPPNVTVNCATPGATLRYTTNGLEPTTSDPTVAAGGTLAVTVTTTLKVKGWRSDWEDSTTAIAEYSLQVATPVLSPTGGSFTSAPSVTVTTATPGATIRYTTNGVEPTPADPSVASGGSIVVGSAATLKAKAFREGWTPSAVASDLYMLSLSGAPTPTFAPAAGTYTVAKTVTIATSTAGATIHYTLDGSDPSASSPIFAKPILVGATTTVKARAYAPDRSASAVGSATYTINSGAVAAPSLSEPSGTYTTTRTVTITCATSGATIRYTTSGLDPTTSDTSIASGGSITVSKAMIVKAAAWKSGMTTSPVTRRDYVITGAVAAGANHSLALKGDGSVVAWGYNGYGQIGDATSGTSRLTPVQVDTLMSGVTAIAAGANHSLALKSNGSVVAWGNNSYGQVGDNSSGTDRKSPVQVFGLTSGVVAIAAGYNHSVALKSDGSVVAWGANNYGQIGDNDTDTRIVPTQVVGLTSGVVAIAAGRYHSLALKSDGSVVAWGLNSSGQLGVPGTSQSLTPVTVPNLSGISAVFAGHYVSQAIRGLGATPGEAWGWGGNDQGQVGDGTSGMDRAAPVRGSSSLLSISPAEGHVLAVARDGSAWGWGANASGQLGQGIANPKEVRPARIGSLVEAMAVAAGTSHSLALSADGRVRGWGYNSNGQVGDGSIDARTEPRLVSGLELVANAWLLQDSDSDGLTNIGEYRLGLDPLSADTNGDGVSDGAAVFSHASATSPDSDGDGLLNVDEVAAGTDPLRVDTDGDGTADAQDCYPLDATKTTCPPNPSDHTPPVVTLTEPPGAVPYP